MRKKKSKTGLMFTARKGIKTVKGWKIVPLANGDKKHEKGNKRKIFDKKGRLVHEYTI